MFVVMSSFGTQSTELTEIQLEDFLQQEGKCR